MRLSPSLSSLSLSLVLLMGSVASLQAATPPDPPADLTPTQVGAIVDAYLSLGASLVAGDATWAGKHAAKLQDASTVTPEIQKLVKDFPKDLKAQRLQFKPLSEAMITLAAAYPKAAGGTVVVYCSMAPGRWLQRGTAVKNPYYGAEMLACGTVQGPPSDKNRAR
jgi:hypothetical protein